MSEEKKVQRSHRLCPCSPMDIEGIQTWLEDMASDGLILDKESIFFGFWSFVRSAPQKAQYRLEVVQSKFLEDSDTPQPDMVETADAMGWEFVIRYRSFYIYRSTDPQVRPLNTDPAVQALTVKKLRHEKYSELLLDALYVFAILFLRRSSFGFFFRDAAMVGPVYALCVLGFYTFMVLQPLVHVLYLHRAGKRLRNGDALDRKKPWKPKALLWTAWRITPVIMCAAIIGGLLSSLLFSTENYPLTEYSGDSPFATIEEVYPEGSVIDRTDMGDYNTFLTWSTAVSENTEWKESGYVAVNSEKYHFILRLTYHETAANWLAQGLAKDYYEEDSNRYHGKRFEALPTPETDIDYIRVYTSYDIRYVLLQHGNKVVHAVISIDEGQEADHWEQWLQTMIQELKAS